MNGYLAFLLLLVAAGLLVLAAGWSATGHAEWRRNAEAKVLLFGLAIGYLTYFLIGTVLVFFPLAIAAVAMTARTRSALPDAGTFLVACAGSWVVFLGLRHWNDLADPAVTQPGWTPYPLALAAALTVLGLVLRFGARRADWRQP